MCQRLILDARNRYVKLVMSGMDEHAAWSIVMGELKIIYNGVKK